MFKDVSFFSLVRSEFFVLGRLQPHGALTCGRVLGCFRSFSKWGVWSVEREELPRVSLYSNLRVCASQNHF